MDKVINKLRLFFCTFSGEDDYIIRKCNTRIQISFALIGLSVLVIFVGCWLSASFFMAELFERSSKWLSIPIGIIWALLITNMYLLLLYTVSPTILPHSSKRSVNGKRKKIIVEVSEDKPKSAFSPSFIFRMVFICFLAIIIAQPLNVFLWSSFSEKSLSNFKTEYRINMMIVADSSLIKQEVQNQTDFYQNINTKIHVNDSLIVARNVQLLNDKVSNDNIFLVNSKVLLDTLSKWNKLPFTKNFKRMDSLRTVLSDMLDEELKSDDEFIVSINNIQFTNKFLQLDFENYRNALKSTIEAKINNYNRLNELLGKSNFYVKSIQILLSENPVAWLTTILVCGIFMLPIYWKFRIRNHGGFYEVKKNIENQLVQDSYNEFKKKYSLIFETRIRQYNRQTWLVIMHYLRKLEEIDIDKYSELRKTIKEELVDESISKYEYWADPPFRTKQKQPAIQIATEQDLLKTIYPSKN